MKKIFAIALLAISSTVSANNVIVNGTRFIYPAKEREITVQLNNTANRPALVQTWLDNGNPNESPDTIVTPFIITPPITKVEANSGQTLRIKAGNVNNLPKDRESLWYLNVLEVPPSNVAEGKEDKNVLQMAIRSRFKFIYRPTGLGDSSNAVKQLSFKSNGNNVTIENPTPFYITISVIGKTSGQTLNKETVTVKPKSSVSVSLKAAVRANEQIKVGNLNDYGTLVESVLTIK